MKKMAMAVAFATMMAFTMMTMGCGGGETTTPKPVTTPKVTPKAAVTSGTVTPKAP